MSLPAPRPPEPCRRFGRALAGILLLAGFLPLPDAAQGAGPEASETAPRPGLAAEARAAPLFRLTLLGTGNPRPSPDRLGPAILVEAGSETLLIDAGRGATQRIFEIGSGALLRSVDTVLLTHLHSDHLVGLPDLWLSGRIFGRHRPVRLLGPEGTVNLARHLELAFAFEVRVRTEDEGFPAEGGRFEARDVQAGVVLEGEGLQVRAFPVDHGPEVKPAFGYRLDFGGRFAVISGDTRPTEELVRWSRGADVVIHEVLSPEVERRRAQVVDPKAVEKIIARHTTPEQAGKLFAEAKPRLAVYTHVVPSPATAEDLIPPTRKHYDGPLAVGYDLMAITIGETVEVHPRRTIPDS